MEINRETCEYQRQTNATFTDVDCDIYLKLRILQSSKYLSINPFVSITTFGKSRINQIASK